MCVGEGEAEVEGKVVVEAEGEAEVGRGEEAAGEATKEKGARRRGRGRFEQGECRCIPPASSSIYADFELIMKWTQCFRVDK